MIYSSQYVYYPVLCPSSLLLSPSYSHHLYLHRTLMPGFTRANWKTTNSWSDSIVSCVPSSSVDSKWTLRRNCHQRRKSRSMLVSPRCSVNGECASQQVMGRYTCLHMNPAFSASNLVMRSKYTSYSRQPHMCTKQLVHGTIPFWYYVQYFLQVHQDFVEGH